MYSDARVCYSHWAGFHCNLRRYNFSPNCYLDTFGVHCCARALRESQQPLHPSILILHMAAKSNFSLFLLYSFFHSNDRPFPSGLVKKQGSQAGTWLWFHRVESQPICPRLSQGAQPRQGPPQLPTSAPLTIRELVTHNKFELWYYGQVNSLRLKSSVASKWARKHLRSNIYFAGYGTYMIIISIKRVLCSIITIAVCYTLF